MSNIELHQNPSPLATEMEYAKAVSTGSLLPREYQNNPANVLIAMGLGDAMGLSPAESLYRITVIQGKPTASAELIAANVRKAGHKLRVRGDDTSATAQIVRADDPDFVFEVTRDVEWARGMGLLGKDNYKKQPGTMLQWRAITAVARLACPEALYGVAYSSDEMYDTAPAPTGGGSRLGAALGGPMAAPITFGESVNVAAADGSAADNGAKGDAPKAGESVPPAVAPADSPEPNVTDAVVLLSPSSKLARGMFAALGDAGIADKGERLAFCSEIVGREITTSGELTEDEADEITAAANRYAAMKAES